jgi:ankyrin repeat protein
MTTMTPLQIAAYFSKIDEVRRLLTENVPVNATNAFGRTALHYAVGNDDLRVEEELVRAGACWNIKDVCGVSPGEALDRDGNPKSLTYQAIREKADQETTLEVESISAPSVFKV